MRGYLWIAPESSRGEGSDFHSTVSERRIGYTITPGNETSQCSRAIVLLVSLSGNCVVSRAPEICLPPIRSTRYHLQGWPRQSLVPRGLIETFTSSKGTQTNQQFIFGDNTFSIPGSIDPHPASSVVWKDKSLRNDISLICPNIDGSHLPHYTPNDSTLRLLPKCQNRNQNSSYLASSPELVHILASTQCWFPVPRVG